MDEAGSGASQYLTREQMIKEVSEIHEEDYNLPNGGKIRLQGLQIRNGLNAFSGVQGDPSERLLRLMIMGIKEPALGPEDLEWLRDATIGVAQKIASRIMELSGLKTDSEDVLEKAEEFLKVTPSPNSSTSIVQNTSTDSPPS